MHALTHSHSHSCTHPSITHALIHSHSHNPQATEWLISHLRAASPSLEVTTQHEPRFAHTLELAVRFGKTLVGRSCCTMLKWLDQNEREPAV